MVQPLTNDAVKIAVISIFPDMFTAVSGFGITSRAVKQGLVQIKTWSPREFAHDKHSTVDDRPFGGGPGMVMMLQPLRDSIVAAKQWAGADARVIYLSPQGRTLTQRGVETLYGYGNLILVAGRYEGIDERLMHSLIDEEWSIGDYVLSGGELPAMVLIDAVTRLIPGALGHAQSAEQDSFSDGLLDCPHYTRPEEIDGMRVPDVLLSGHHKQIQRWRLKQSLGRTWLKRPDLLAAIDLSEEQRKLLTEFRRDLEAD